MDVKFVTISLVGIDGSVFDSFKIPCHATVLMFLRGDDNWYFYLSSYSRIGCVNESKMKKIAYISGLNHLHALHSISITREAPSDGVLLPFRYWPEAKSLMNRVDSLTVESEVPR